MIYAVESDEQRTTRRKHKSGIIEAWSFYREAYARRGWLSVKETWLGVTINLGYCFCDVILWGPTLTGFGFWSRFQIHRAAY